MAPYPFTPPPGLFTDQTYFADGGRWIACTNVRFWEGKPQTIGGWASRGASVLSSTCNAIHEWVSSAGTTYVAYGCTSNLYVETGGVLYDITPTGSPTGKWTFANYGDTLIANVSGGKIYQWSLNTAVVAAQVTNAPTTVTTILVTPQRQLLAFGCNEVVSGTFNGKCVRCSDLEDITDWTPTSTNFSDEIVLDGATSSIVSAALVGEYIGVWTSSNLLVGQYVGDPGQTYRFDRAGSNCGSCGLKAIVVVNGTAYWLDPSVSFRAWAPGAEPVYVPCTMIDFFRGEIATSTKADVFAAYVAKFNEIWFTHPKASGSYLGRYAAMSLTDQSWFRGDCGRRAMHQGITNLIAADNSGNRLTCESGQFGEGAKALTCSLDSSYFYLNDAQTRVMIRGIRPDFQNQAGSITLTVTTGNDPQGSSEVQHAYTLAANIAKKDFRASGRVIRVSLASSDLGTSTNTFWRLGRPVFDIVPMGER